APGRTAASHRAPGNEHASAAGPRRIADLDVVALLIDGGLPALCSHVERMPRGSDERMSLRSLFSKASLCLAVPLGNVFDPHADNRRVAQRHALVLLVFAGQEIERVPVVVAFRKDVRDAIDADPRALRPVLLVNVGEDARAPIRLDIPDAP